MDATRTWRGLVAVAAVVVIAGESSAQPIPWQTDYAAAVREAGRTGRPILLDFGTESCVWCKRLDATTFRNPAIAAVIGKQFVAVKVDAERTPQIARELGVHSFPTLILAGPDGAILDRHEGYADAATLRPILDRVLAKLPAPAAAAPPPPTPTPQPAPKAVKTTPAPAGPATDRRTRAAALLALAQLDDQLGCPDACRGHCRTLIAEFADCPETTTARVLALKSEAVAEPKASPPRLR